MATRSPACVVMGLALLGAGCVHSYQPLSGLHRPVVVDITAPNLAGVRLSVLCVPGDYVSEGEAELLCDRVGRLFQNQGATVTTSTGQASGSAVLGLPAEDLAILGAGGEGAAADLVVELRAREIHARSDVLAWALYVGSATLIPVSTESSFAQEVVVRDPTGFLLAQDRLEGRIVRTLGTTYWAGTKLLDLGRRPEDRSNDDAVHARFSADFYGQLSQVVFNAKMRWEVLREATPAGRATGAGSTGSSPGRTP